ncbi:MAG: hypothetical protein M1827_004650 [Pycnora praestabilis]|nr:MAG: hypothetical protein M1827_004650 [Pycnora praestabilis]
MHPQESAEFSDVNSSNRLFEAMSDIAATTGIYEEFPSTARLDASHMSSVDLSYGTPSPGPYTWYEEFQGNGNSSLIDRDDQVVDRRKTLLHALDQGRRFKRTSTKEQIPYGVARKAPGIREDFKSELESQSPPRQMSSAETSKIPSHQFSAAISKKSTSPIDLDASSKETTRSSTRTIPDTSSTRSPTAFRPRSSIPSDLRPEEYARQCILAACSSRLTPWALHPDEYRLLRNHIGHSQTTNYLNIRNGILRLWTRNPLVGVTREEAAGCSRDSRSFGMADVAYEWLIRRGYINFGCLEVPNTTSTLPRSNMSQRGNVKRKTIVVVGAGMAGLGCARQLEGLFSQLGERLSANDEEVPNVIVLEGRSRIGGRIYSHRLKTQATETLPHGLNCTAEMGAQVITGFDHGNPLSMIIRGQLALHYYPLKDNSILYDTDGSTVDKERDVLVEKLFNDMLDRASVYRHKNRVLPTVEGDKQLVTLGRDSTGEDVQTIAQSEQARNLARSIAANQGTGDHGNTGVVPVGIDKLTGKAHLNIGRSIKSPAATVAKTMGWQLRPGIHLSQSLDLDASSKTQGATLGAAMDQALKQYQDLVIVNQQDMRLLNWHYANLEYANAVNVDQLSLGGWDQDIGNEFEGEHAEIIGGYLQVPRGIWQSPRKLDVRTRKVIKRVTYNRSNGMDDATDTAPATVECEDGETFEADHVIITVPLGVLKEDAVQFEPALPDWKSGAIQRLGYGILNKVVLVYDYAFWDKDRDMFGLLREPDAKDSLYQADYTSTRGRFYLFWNCIETSGRPMLIALMAGDAARHTESSEDDDLVAEVTDSLRKMFAPKHVPEPSEVVITRWGKDRFARGSYSYVAKEALLDDYDAMARPVGNLHFAGEATCGTHPATVHGAYLSGLRAASEVIDSIMGPIPIPLPLVVPKIKTDNTPNSSHQEYGADGIVLQKAQELIRNRLDTYEMRILNAIYNKIGARPVKPSKSGANPFLIYQKDHWFPCKAKCDEARGASSRNSTAKASRNEIRAALGQMWREASAEEKRPYLEQTASNKEANMASAARFKTRVEVWDREAETIRQDFANKNPCVPGEEETELLGEAEIQVERERGRRVKKVGGYAEDSDLEMKDLTL